MVNWIRVASDHEFVKFLKSMFLPLTLLLIANFLWANGEKELIAQPNWKLVPPGIEVTLPNIIRFLAYIFGGFMAIRHSASPLLGASYVAVFLMFIDHIIIALLFIYLVQNYADPVKILQYGPATYGTLLISFTQAGLWPKVASFGGGTAAALFLKMFLVRTDLTRCKNCEGGRLVCLEFLKATRVDESGNRYPDSWSFFECSSCRARYKIFINGKVEVPDEKEWNRVLGFKKAPSVGNDEQNPEPDQ